MFTFRTLLLTTPGLLLSLAAAAQSATLSPANQDMVSWMTQVTLGAVCLLAVLVLIVLAASSDPRPFVAANAPTAATTTAAPVAAVGASATAAAARVAQRPVVPAATAPLVPELALSEQD